MRSVFSAMRGAEVQKNRDDWKAMLQSRGKRDLYVTRQAEGLTFVQGTIFEGDADGKRLTFEREDGQKVDLLQSRATGGLVLNPTAVGQPPKTLCKVIDVFGNTLFRIVGGLRVGLELSWWATQWVDNPTATAFRVETAVLYAF